MNSKRIFYLIIISFAIMGAVTGYFRHTKTAMPFFPKESRDIWSIEAKIEFNPQKSPILVSLNLPDSTLGYKIFSEQSVSAGYGF
ncbi:MAG: UUP1 family membrane protein, partial [Sulfurospirillaceae bacterium]